MTTNCIINFFRNNPIISLMNYEHRHWSLIIQWIIWRSHFFWGILLISLDFRNKQINEILQSDQNVLPIRTNLSISKEFCSFILTWRFLVMSIKPPIINLGSDEKYVWVVGDDLIDQQHVIKTKWWTKIVKLFLRGNILK